MMIVHAAKPLYWFNTIDPPCLKKVFRITLDSHYSTVAIAVVFIDTCSVQM